MKKIAIAALLSSFVAAPAFAADNGFYAGVSLGQARTNVPGAFGASTKSNDTVYGILAGYQFDKNWAAEAEYTGVGKYTTATVSGKADAFAIAAVGTLPMSDTFSLYGKLGVAQVSGKASGGTASNANRTSATYGLGVQYNATQAIGIRFGWDRFGAAANSGGATQNYNSNLWRVAAVFKF